VAGAPEPELTLLKEAQQLQRHGGDHKSETFKLQQEAAKPQNQASNTSLKPPIGAQNEHSNTTFVSRGAAYIRARLERDGKPECPFQGDNITLIFRFATDEIASGGSGNPSGIGAGRVFCCLPQR
jgi:hypothetical protein